MRIYKNFKSVTLCVAHWAQHVTEEQLRKEADWLQKYVGIEKVYLETFRGELVDKSQLIMIKKILEEDYGIEVSGAITTVTPDLNDSDKKRQRLFETMCYCNEAHRKLLKEVSEYTASIFDEYIIDDFFFTQCMCEDCQREKGNKSWEEFRLEKMQEVSKNLVIDPAKKVNPKINIIIKYPNWRESYQETGYNPGQQREIFDAIYTGTETRHGAQQDQHLPRYLSYSLVRWMDNVMPGKNGGGWFDPFDCDRIDTYLEQAYLTAFSKAKEIMMFCWSAIYNNKRATPLGFLYQKLDKIMGQCGNPVGLPVYIPFNSQGEDHIEDFLGMIGIPFEPTPDFPSKGSVFVTAAALKDKQIVQKIKTFVNEGGKVLATSGFMIGALKDYPEIKELTSITYNNRRLEADEFQVSEEGMFGKKYVKSSCLLSFPLLEHRNNATWSIMNAGHGEYHESILMYDTYGKGKFEVVNLPDMPSRIRDMPPEALTLIRYEFLGEGKIWLDGGYGVSLFTYDNDTFGVYCYTNDGCAPVEFNAHIKGKYSELEFIKDGEKLPFWMPASVPVLYTRSLKFRPKDEAYDENDYESVFHGRINPGDFLFFKLKKGN